MASQEHFDLLKQGVEVWNQWRKEHSDIEPDLNGADLRKAELRKADLSEAWLKLALLREANLAGADLYGAILNSADLYGANLSKTNLYDASFYGANLSKANFNGADFNETSFIRANLNEAQLNGADLYGASLNGADLTGANLTNARLSRADLTGANLTNARLTGANLSRANLTGANLSGAFLYSAVLVESNLTGATLTECSIYGISVWNVQLEGARQDNLVITSYGEPTITVDNLKIAQFIHLLLNNREIREVIDTLTSKVVLILGRFTAERKAVLDAIREGLRKQNYLPILFDFDKPSSQDLTETVSTLAHLSRFIIVDLTDPSSAPYEVAMIASNHIRPIQALFQPSNEAKRVSQCSQTL